jgi:TatD DNase family protein
MPDTSFRLFDSHTHLDQYDPGELPGILSRARENSVQGIIVAGVTIESSERSVLLAQDHPGYLWAGVGVHPMEPDIDLTNADIKRLRELAADPRVVCISEVGLDYQSGTPDARVQERALRDQLRIAVDENLPVIFHNRDAGSEPLRILDEELRGRVPAVAHYFQGPTDYARGCLERDFYVSLAKPLLRLPDLQNIVRDIIPLERIVLETDAYPQPFKRNRSSWTEPFHVTQVAEKVAELKSVTVEEVAKTTSANLERLLGRSLSLQNPD